MKQCIRRVEALSNEKANLEAAHQDLMQEFISQKQAKEKVDREKRTMALEVR